MAENIIEEWLKSLNLPQYAESFLDNGYDDLEICKQIGEPDLDAIGVLNSAHRTEILCAVKNLREQGGAAVYFTLEGPDNVDRNGDDAKHEDLATPPSSVHSSPRKYKTMDAYEEGKMELVKIPRLQLKLMIRDKLLEDGIHLGSYPYTNPIKVSSPGPCNGAESKGKDGSPGYIDALALRYAGELNTHYHDVLDRLEELRKRRVSQEIESLSTKSADSSPRSPLPHQQRFGPGIHAKHSPNAYYGEVPHAIYGFYGIYGLTDMKNKDSPKRGQNPRSQSFDAGIYSTEHHEIEPKKKVGGLGKLFRGVSRKKDRSPKHSKGVYKTIEGDINACDTPMSDEDRMKLMMMVREGHISMAEAVEKVKARLYEAGKKTEKELEHIEAQDGGGGSKAGFFKMPSFRKKKQDKFEDQRHSFFSSHEYFGNEGTKHASHFYDDPPYESDDSDKVNTFSPEILRRYPDGTEIVNGDFSKYGCLKRQRRNGKNSNSERSPGDIDDIIQEKQEITGSNGISYTPGIYGCYKGDYIDPGSRSDTYGEVVTSIERPKTGVLDKFKNFTKSGSISEEGLSHSSDYEDQDEFDRKMERRLSRDLSGRANAIMGRMKGIKKDVKRRISRLRTTKTGTDIEATDPSTQDSVLRSGSSVESLPSGSGSASGSSIQPPTTSSSNRSSSSVEEDPNIYSGPFIGKARALVDYTPSPYDRDALKLKKGDVIDIISMNQSGTWAGRLNNKIGSFKFINVEVIPETNVRQRRSRYPRRRNSKKSKPKTVEELLTRISLEEYISVFLLNGYENLDLFKEIEEEDLDDLGINDAEHRAKILTAAELLQDYDAPDSPINESIPSSISSNLDPSSSQSDTSKLSGDTVLTPKQYQSPRDSGCYASNENLLHKEKHNSKIEMGEAEISQSESGFAVSADSEDLSISPRHSEDWSTTDKENVSMNNLANQEQQVGKESKKNKKDHFKSEETQTELSVVRTLYNAQQKVNFCTGDTNDSSSKLNSSSKTVVIHRSSSQSSAGSETTKSPLPGVKPKVKNSSFRKLSSSSTESWEHKESSAESSAEASKPIKAITDNLGTSYKKQVVIEDGLISKTPPPIPKRPGKHHKQKDSPSPDKKLTSDSLPGSPRVKSATIPRPQLQKCPTVPHSQSHHSNVKTLAGNFQDAANQKSPQKQNNLKTKRTPRPVSVTLESLLFRKLQDEMIDLSKEPYTDRTGFCGIPPALVQRYAEEMKRDIREVAEALDQVRIMTLQEQGKHGVPNDFLADSCQSPVLEFNHFSLNDWLVSLGLPMYSELLIKSGFSQLEQISQMNEANFKTCGVNDPRHLRRLLNGVEELCFYLEKFHC